jgi:hypothetical protein
MLKNILNFEGVNALTKAQQKSIIGGNESASRGTCCGRRFFPCGINGDHLCSSVSCGVSKSVALSLASGEEGGNWCCSSCGSASWL